MYLVINVCVGSGFQRWSLRARYGVCFFQAEDGIRDLVRSRGLGDVYKRQVNGHPDQLTLRRLKKQKLALKDTITRIEDQLIPDIIA